MCMEANCLSNSIPKYGDPLVLDVKIDNAIKFITIIHDGHQFWIYRHKVDLFLVVADMGDTGAMARAPIKTYHKK